MSNMKKKRIVYEDDFVVVKEGKNVIYQGIEDYEPMKYEDWVWNEKSKTYKFGKYTKTCYGA